MSWKIDGIKRLAVSQALHFLSTLAWLASYILGGPGAADASDASAASSA